MPVTSNWSSSVDRIEIERDQQDDDAEQKGAAEGDQRSDKEPGNKNAVGTLDKNGLPKNN